MWGHINLTETNGYTWQIYGGTMKKSSHSGLLMLSDIATPFLTLFIVIVVYIFFSPPSSHPDNEVIDMTKGWVSQNGQILSMRDLPKGDLVLTQSIKDIQKYNQSICMKSSDTWLEIAFDGQTAYKYAPVQEPIFGASYGLYVHMVSIPMLLRSH